MASPKRITISGYYGLANAGDEAVLSAIISGLKAQGGDDIDITVLSAAPEQTARDHGVKAVPRMAIAEVTSALRDCDLLISGGGSLLQDATSLKSLLYYLGIIALARRYERRVMLLGQGIGPLRRRISRGLTSRVLNTVDLITVRDPASAALLAEIGVRNPPVRVTADPTFMLEPCGDDEAIRLLESVGIAPDEEVIVAAFRDWVEATDLERASGEAFAEILRKLRVRILLLTLQRPRDEALAARIRETVPSSVMQPEMWTPEQYLGVIRRCKLMVGMRLHALIFAAAVGTPSIGITYDPKVESLLRTTRQRSVSLEEVASGQLAKRVMEAWESREGLASSLEETVPALREAARENIRMALEVLSEGI